MPTRGTELTCLGQVTDSLAGRLLVASPALLDPNFLRSVVLIVQHDDEGALGVTLNRPLDTPAEEYVPEWAPHLSPPGQVFIGGPVQREVAVGVARRLTPVAGTWGSVEHGIGLIDLGESPSDTGDVVDLRVFAGYAGWDGAQLEFELGTGSWFVVDLHPNDPFSRQPDGLWRAVLRRQQSALAMFGDFPDDPRRN